jgi:hypothetical protein
MDTLRNLAAPDPPTGYHYQGGISSAGAVLRMGRIEKVCVVRRPANMGARIMRRPSQARPYAVTSENPCACVVGVLDGTLPRVSQGAGGRDGRRFLTPNTALKAHHRGKRNVQNDHSQVARACCVAGRRLPCPRAADHVRCDLNQVTTPPSRTSRPAATPHARTSPRQ